MSEKTNNIIIQEGKKYYSEEAAEETKETSQGEDELDGEDKEFEEAHAKEIKFNRKLVEEITASARS